MNGDVAGKFCNKSVDLIEFSVTSIPKQNNILCLGVIPKGTESEKKYMITWHDFRAAAVLMTSYKDCGKEGCRCCQRVMQLLGNAEVQDYLGSDGYQAGKVPVETAMCDNFKGWGNFAINELGIVSNFCLPHASGNVHSTSRRCKLSSMLMSCMAAIAADNYSHLQYFGGRRDA